MDNLPVQPQPNSSPTPEAQYSPPTDYPASPAPKKSILPLIIIPFIFILLCVIGYEGYLYYQQTINQQEEVILKPQPVVKKPLTLIIESPNDSTIVTSDQVLVKGKTLPNTIVTIYTDNTETSLESDTTGNFEGNIKVGNGINTLTVTAFGENDEEKSLVLDVVYDKES